MQRMGQLLRRNISVIVLIMALISVGSGALYLALPAWHNSRVVADGRHRNAALLQAGRSQLAPETRVEALNLGEPVAIKVPRLAVTAPVKSGGYNTATRRWTLD